MKGIFAFLGLHGLRRFDFQLILGVFGTWMWNGLVIVNILVVLEGCLLFAV